MLKRIKSLAFLKNYAESKGVTPDYDGSFYIDSEYIVSGMFEFFGKEFEMSINNSVRWPYKTGGSRGFSWPEWMVEDVD